MRIPLIILFLLLATSGFAQFNEPAFFVFLNSNPDKEQLPEEKVQELQMAHLANIEHLYAIGKLTAAGPFEGGGGIFVLRAPDLDSAQNILSTDPAVKAGRFSLEIYLMDFIIGKNCPLDSVYKMKTYDFVRLKPRFSKEKNPFNAAEINKEHQQDKLLLAFAMLPNNEQVLIMPDTNRQNTLRILQNYPDSDWEKEIKRLWIADGTFCKE